MPADFDAAANAETAVRQAVSLVCVSLPHLSGLAHSVRIAADERVNSAGVFPSGRLLVNPQWFVGLTSAERAFALAHELLHLALHTHTRAIGADRGKFNVAHDLIINDMLETELGIPTPGGGLRRPGARNLSAEALMLDPSLPQPGGDTALGAAMRAALARRGHDSAPELHGRPDDVLDERLEAEWFPDETTQVRAAAIDSIQREATKVSALQRIQESARAAAAQVADQAASARSAAVDENSASAYVEALHITYRPPWELALHRWLDTVTAPRRTYSRPSRRSADRTDVALSGRSRDAQTISIVLDTSGSMTDEIAHALGSIVAFGRGANIEMVRIVQCDTHVTSDEVVAIDDLGSYRVAGFGGSDITPAMVHLADDPDTTAVVVITDGAIHYPREPMPYQVLWVVYSASAARRFTPRYGQVIYTETHTYT